MVNNTTSDARFAWLTIPQRAALERAPKLTPEKQWWDLPAKRRVALRIADEEYRLAGSHRNDPVDAMRHARWGNRTAAAVGPIYATLAGIGHEAGNLLFDGHPLSESLMDIHNNAEGIDAVRKRRAIDASRLQNSPQSMRAAGARAARGYPDDPSHDPQVRYPARQYRTYPPYR